MQTNLKPYLRRRVDAIIAYMNEHPERIFTQASLARKADCKESALQAVIVAVRAEGHKILTINRFEKGKAGYQLAPPPEEP